MFYILPWDACCKFTFHWTKNKSTIFKLNYCWETWMFQDLLWLNELEAFSLPGMCLCLLATRFFFHSTKLSCVGSCLEHFLLLIKKKKERKDESLRWFGNSSGRYWISFMWFMVESQYRVKSQTRKLLLWENIKYKPAELVRLLLSVHFSEAKAMVWYTSVSHYGVMTSDRWSQSLTLIITLQWHLSLKLYTRQQMSIMSPKFIEKSIIPEERFGYLGNQLQQVSNLMTGHTQNPRPLTCPLSFWRTISDEVKAAFAGSKQ